MSQNELFPSDRRDEQEPYLETRLNRHQLMDDRAFYVELLRLVYEAGPRGLPMRELINHGIERGWWQDTAHKHFGEKMRAAWAYGLLTVPDNPGTKGTDRKRIVHPAYFEVRFQSNWLQESWTLLTRALGSMNFTRRDLAEERGFADHIVEDEPK